MITAKVTVNGKFVAELNVARMANVAEICRRVCHEDSYRIDLIGSQITSIVSIDREHVAFCKRMIEKWQPDGPHGCDNEWWRQDQLSFWEEELKSQFQTSHY